MRKLEALCIESEDGGTSSERRNLKEKSSYWLTLLLINL